MPPVPSVPVFPGSCFFPASPCADRANRRCLLLRWTERSVRVCRAGLRAFTSCTLELFPLVRRELPRSFSFVFHLVDGLGFI